MASASLAFAAVSDSPNAMNSQATIANGSNTATLFVMSDAPAKEPWINDQNACMHLKPRFSASLAPGASATVRCRIGISRRGLEDVWGLYRELPKRE